jgi:hypothetical protein
VCRDLEVVQVLKEGRSLLSYPPNAYDTWSNLVRVVVFTTTGLRRTELTATCNNTGTGPVSFSFSADGKPVGLERVVPGGGSVTAGEADVDTVILSGLGEGQESDCKGTIQVSEVIGTSSYP